MDKTVVRGGDKKRLGEYVSGLFELTFLPWILVSLLTVKYIEDITQPRQDMNFIFE